MKYLEEGVRRGYSPCLNSMGVLAFQSGNYEDTIQLSMTAARLGEDEVMQRFLVTYQNPGSAHQAANEWEMNDPREYARHQGKFKDKMVSTGGLEQA